MRFMIASAISKISLPKVIKLFILSLLVCIDQRIKVQVAFIKGGQRVFDISIEAKASHAPPRGRREAW